VPDLKAAVPVDERKHELEIDLDLGGRAMNPAVIDAIAARVAEKLRGSASADPLPG
jgi:hypothetical protein